MYDFPELIFVTRHGCEPWQDLAVKLMLKWPGLHYSTSAFAPKHYPKAIIDYANTRGADKIIYAGYFPMGLSLERIMTEMPNVGLQGRGVAEVPAQQRAACPRPRQVGKENPMSVDFTAFDADNHYYEATDAFIRHVDPAMHKRCMQWAELNGKQRLLVGGKVNRFIPNPTFDPVARPGSLDEYFRGRNPDAKDIKSMFGALEPISPAYRDPAARLAVMDEQGLDGAFMFPTLGVGMEVSLNHDVPALVAAFKGFNRWLEEDWGFNYQERIFAAPMISLVDVDAAIEEVEYALERDARIVCVKSGPVYAPNERVVAGRSPPRPGVGAVERGRRDRRRSTPATPATAATSRTGRTPATSSRSASRRSSR